MENLNSFKTNVVDKVCQELVNCKMDLHQSQEQECGGNVKLTPADIKTHHLFLTAPKFFFAFQLVA